MFSVLLSVIYIQMIILVLKNSFRRYIPSSGLTLIIVIEITKEFHNPASVLDTNAAVNQVPTSGGEVLQQWINATVVEPHVQ